MSSGFLDRNLLSSDGSVIEITLNAEIELSAGDSFVFFFDSETGGLDGFNRFGASQGDVFLDGEIISSTSLNPVGGVSDFYFVLSPIPETKTSMLITFVLLGVIGSRFRK